jgi:methionine synthase I (cobalamin-dependent)
VRDINYEGARIGRQVADRWLAEDPDKPRFVAGSIGPLNVMLSMSSDVNDPGARKVTFDQVYQAYREQVAALYEGGVDLFLIETITDTLNCKAAIKAIMDLRDEGTRSCRSGSAAPSPTARAAPCRARRPRRSGTRSSTASRSPWASTAPWAPT